MSSRTPYRDYEITTDGELTRSQFWLARYILRSRRDRRVMIMENVGLYSSREDAERSALQHAIEKVDFLVESDQPRRRALASGHR
ncbi:hypothetical protein GCM10007205_28740 [Oxalicibacterium flavum]|uniref:Uncharacterized protein n=1 Tax=Oxalicibacterium flavum TaxID=179467 RepID=A0A8J2XVP8_9BURK|nr:hypothetical protein [Oxalicibacterium flavum]GGC17994.1 hypothetical protein GCM10007205_28740 [Oxalicibacterium flavum]